MFCWLLFYLVGDDGGTFWFELILLHELGSRSCNHSTSVLRGHRLLCATGFCSCIEIFHFKLVSTYLPATPSSSIFTFVPIYCLNLCFVDCCFTWLGIMVGHFDLNWFHCMNWDRGRATVVLVSFVGVDSLYNRSTAHCTVWPLLSTAHAAKLVITSHNSHQAHHIT